MYAYVYMNTYTDVNGATLFSGLMVLREDLEVAALGGQRICFDAYFLVHFLVSNPAAPAAQQEKRSVFRNTFPLDPHINVWAGK